MNIGNSHLKWMALRRTTFALAMMAVGGGCAPEGPPTGTDEPVSAVRAAVTAGGTTATVSIYSQWSDGYCANVVVKNQGTTTTSSWTVRLNIGAMTTSTIWNATGAKSGTTLTLTNMSYNAAIPSQGTVSAGYCAQGASPIVIPTVIADGDSALIWPNAISSANSDPWIAQHHDEITEMHPKALVINFVNWSTASAVKDRWDLMARAMAEGSRYHGYNDPAAKPFVIHELLKQVNVVDNPIPAGWTKPNSTKTPRVTTSDGVRLDYAQLYSQAFADLYAIPDPQNPSHNLTLCELLQKGIMNELFIAIDNSENNGFTPEIIEYKQMYDSHDQALPGQFDPYAGNGWFQPVADLPEARACGRSLRVDFLEMNNGLDGALHVLGHNYEHLGRAVPNVDRFYAALYNRDFASRFNTFFNSWYDIAVAGSTTNFLSYPSNQSVAWTCPSDTGCAGQQGVISPFTQGCGNTHYPANARNSYDYQNTVTVLTRCEHYGLHDGPNGQDLTSPYNVQTLANLTQQFGNGPNGGAWQLYLFQSTPGYGSRASTDDGVHIKNFWPYLYY